MNIQLIPSWLTTLADEFQQPYMYSLKQFLTKEKQLNKIIYPKSSEIFQALNTTPIEQVKVVILGQDPYHGPNQAHGLCFSVKSGTALPPSLVNIFKELKTDLNVDNRDGCLIPWAQQGVLLLNNVLTVEHSKAASHQGKGWERFTDKVVACVNQQCNEVVFLLWGSQAQKKGAHINKQKHLVLKAPHPSPLSAYRGFFGCKHFSQTNTYLLANGKTPIDWITNS